MNDGLTPGTRVQVRNRFDGSWSSSPFEVAEAIEPTPTADAPVPRAPPVRRRRAARRLRRRRGPLGQRLTGRLSRSEPSPRSHRPAQRALSKFSASGAMLAGVAGERLLLVDDEENLRSMLEAALRHLGFEVQTRGDRARGARRAAAADQPAVIVLDVMLPDLDGFEVCRRLRTEGSRTPVLFLTARDGTEDKVRGLTLGGDDYLVKPFSLEELVARVQRGAAPVGPRAARRACCAAPTSRWTTTRTVCCAPGPRCQLSPTEYNLLRYLLINQGRVLSKPQILDHVWQYDFGGDGGVVETYIGYLRRKVDNVEPRLIHTIRGVGYTLRAS